MILFNLTPPLFQTLISFAHRLLTTFPKLPNSAQICGPFPFAQSMDKGMNHTPSSTDSYYFSLRFSLVWLHLLRGTFFFFLPSMSECYSFHISTTFDYHFGYLSTRPLELSVHYYVYYDRYRNCLIYFGYKTIR